MFLERKSRTQILVCPMSEKGEPRVPLESEYITSTSGIFDPEFSPDSKWITYTSTETGAPEVYIQAFPGPGEKHRIPRSEVRIPPGRQAATNYSIWNQPSRETSPADPR